MVTDNNPALRHQLDFMLYNLVPTTVRIDLPATAGAEAMMPIGMPMVQIGAGYSATPLAINNLFVQPRRIEFEVASAPPLLPITLQLACRGPFVFGWLLVPENVQTVIMTAAQRIRIIGPGYWALPLAPAVPVQPEDPEPPSNSASAKPAEKVPETRPGATPAPAKATTSATAP